VQSVSLPTNVRVLSTGVDLFVGQGGGNHLLSDPRTRWEARMGGMGGLRINTEAVPGVVALRS